MSAKHSTRALALWRSTAQKEYPRRPSEPRLRRRNGRRLGVTTVKRELVEREER